MILSAGYIMRMTHKHSLFPCNLTLISQRTPASNSIPLFSQLLIQVKLEDSYFYSLTFEKGDLNPFDQTYMAKDLDESLFEHLHLLRLRDSMMHDLRTFISNLISIFEA
jgi:hypothetical protein